MRSIEDIDLSIDTKLQPAYPSVILNPNRT